MQRRRFVSATGLLATGCATAPLPFDTTGLAGGLTAAEMPPAVPREFRAAWVATVANIDWPSRPGLPAATQRTEALAILNRARAIGLNAIVLQVRPAGDALYASAIEPWSEYLTGAQGRAPEPAYDPLVFWVEEAHRRGLELHAWFNPYRARHSAARTPLAANHMAVAKPSAVKAYGDQLWMDPGEPAAAAQTLAVVADVVRRYDIDGVHFDDYFYPYPVVNPTAKDGADLPFPDDAAWQRYRGSGGTLLRDDWRRSNVDSLVETLYRTVRSLKPGVRVGISPFGIGRPERRPAGIQGFSQYDKLYADVERWLAAGWLDYLAPQLYWPIDRTAQAFAVLLDYWLAQNTAQRHVWPGLFTSMVGAPKQPWPAAEMLSQVALLRTRPAASGHLHFSMAALMQDREGVASALRAGAYAQAALVPATPWLGVAAPAAPRLRPGSAGRVLIEPSAGEAAFVWAVWRRTAGAWQWQVLPAHETALAAAPEVDAVVASAVGRTGAESPRAVLRLR